MCEPRHLTRNPTNLSMHRKANVNRAFVEVCKADANVLHVVQQEGYCMYDGVQGSCACTVKPAIIQRDMRPCTSCSTSAGTDRLHLVLDNQRPPPPGGSRPLPPASVVPGRGRTEMVVRSAVRWLWERGGLRDMMWAC